MDTVTRDSIQAKIKNAEYFHVPDTTMTICVLTLENGFNVTGESASVSKEKFDTQIGEDIALQNAFEKIWMLEGYLLKEKLYQEGKK